MVFIPYGRQSIDQDDIDAVVDVLKSDFLTQGPAVPAFESAISEYCGVQHAVAVNSATSALHIACLALDVGPGDLVWTSAITFVASSNAALYCGAEVDFVDIDSDTYNMCAEMLEQKLRTAEADGTLPKVVIPVHMCGQSCDMLRISELSKKYGFRIIEDASHAIGGSYQSNKVGCCQYSDIAVLSFHPVKIVTSGEGGMGLTNDDDLAASMQLLRSHGVTRDPAQLSKPSPADWYYEQIVLGFNYRMTDIQAALGTSQMVKLDTFILKRRELVARYKALFSDTDLSLPHEIPEALSSFHLYVVGLSEPVAEHRDAIFQRLRARGFGVQLHYIPVYLQPYYRSMGFHEGYCQNAERYYQRSISLPLYPALMNEQQDSVVHALIQEMAA